jgi:hypothetical protein
VTRDLGDQLDGLDDILAEHGGDIDEPTVPRTSVKDDPRHRHRINVNESDLKMLTSRAWTALNFFNDPPYLFANGNTPVRIIGGKHDLPVISEDLSVDTMSRESANTAYWMKYLDKTKLQMVPQFPPERVMRNMLADPEPPLPQLKRITAAPVFGPNGELETADGYHASTGHYFAARGLQVREVNRNPSTHEVEDALTLILDEFLIDFPFVGRSETAHSLSLMLNPFVRDMIDGPTPLYLIESPTAGTGKGLLARMCIYPALGGEPTMMTQADNAEEERKRITGTLVGLPEAILLDNIAEGLDSHNLAAALTTREWSDRILGRSVTRTIPVRNTWMATGNNPSKSSEIARRTIRIRLDAKTERPEERRGFRHENIEAWARANRGDLVHALLTIVQSWIAAGKPKGNHAIGSYDSWAAVHGGILQHINVNGFLENRTEDRAITVSDDSAWTEFVEQWWVQYHGAPVGVADLFRIANDIETFPLGKSPTPRGQKTAFGIALTRNRNRVFNGREIEFVRSERNVAKYRLKVTASDEPDDIPDF